MVKTLFPIYNLGPGEEIMNYLIYIKYELILLDLVIAQLFDRLMFG